MKHTITGLHGHLYGLDVLSAKKGKLVTEKVCISRRHAAKTDLMSMKLELLWKVSRKWKTCWQCHVETEKSGGYANPDRKNTLFYECEKCGK